MRSFPNRPAPAAHYLVLTGNPNCGKTTLFNALTGLRAKVGNYAGVTVERKEGPLLHAPAGLDVRVLDLPGTYSLSPQSLDEQVARDVLFTRLPELPPPTLVVVVVDASNLQRNLYFATQVIELGHPTLIALNMVDVAGQNGIGVDAPALSRQLGVPVVPVVASTGKGMPELRETVISLLKRGELAAARPFFADFPQPLQKEIQDLAASLPHAEPGHEHHAAAEALLLITSERTLTNDAGHYPPEVAGQVAAARRRLEAAGVDWQGTAIGCRYARLAEIQSAVSTQKPMEHLPVSDRIDRVVTHRVWGVVIFLAIMALMFQSIFTVAGYPAGWIDAGMGAAGGWITGHMAPGALRSLLVDGVIAGVGAVVVFLPQILLLFLFIGLLEDTGYMARAAFLMDRLMGKVGLHGKSFIPLLSSFACAIPGIMASRTIESQRDRLVTMLVAPLMSCSARLPVYTLLIAACIPDRSLFGVLKLSALTMLGMYLLGVVVALAMAWLFKNTLLKGETPMLIMELPPYKMPVFKVVMRHMWDRSKVFLRQAGTVILGINILLWFLATYPKSPEIGARFDQARFQAVTNAFPEIRTPDEAAARVAELRENPKKDGREAVLVASVDTLDNDEAGELLRHSFAGRAGRLIEPLIAPLGFDWKMGIGIVTSFAAREVYVSTMATVYSLGGADDSDEGTAALAGRLREQRREDGSQLYTPLTGVTLMVFYVFALQCVSTVAVMRRETNGWKWPLFQWAYMGALAWGLAFLARHIGLWLGWGP